MAELSANPRHGGRLAELQRASGRTDWLDCSTGIAPYAYPLPAVPAEVWQRLPDRDAELQLAAQEYYGCDMVLAVAGSQAAIAGLPQLRAHSRVGVLAGSYAEHGWQWQRQGHQVRELAADEIDAQLDELDVLVLVNPDNPSCRLWPLAQLQNWLSRLQARGGWLVIDEAFADVLPDSGLSALVGQAGLIVLRSVGKFFGLAGVRLGFVLAWPALLSALQRQQGPWSVSHLAQWAGILALRDRAWQVGQRARLEGDASWQRQMLEQAGIAIVGQHPLMHYCCYALAEDWGARLLRAGIYVREFEQPAANGLKRMRLGPVAEPQRACFARRLQWAVENKEW